MGEVASSHLNKIEMHDVDVDESNMISQDVDGDHIKSWVVEA